MNIIQKIKDEWKYRKVLNYINERSHYSLIVAIEPLNLDMNGSYFHGIGESYSKKMSIDSKFFSFNDMSEIYKVIDHELAHERQDYDIDHKIGNYQKYIECRDSNTEASLLFGINKMCNIHIQPDGEQDSIAKIFYYLNIMEREAYFAQYKNDTEKYENRICRRVRDFNKKYNTDLSNEEVFDIIDTCYHLAKENKYPDTGGKDKDNLLATVLYDLVLTGCYQMGTVSKNEYLVAMTNPEKQKVLNRYGYSIYHSAPTNSLYKEYQKKDSSDRTYAKSVELLSSLNEEQLKDNPQLLETLSMRFGEDILSFAKGRGSPDISEIQKDR